MTLSLKQTDRRNFLKQSAALTGAFVLGVQSTHSSAGDTTNPEVTHWEIGRAHV